MTSVLAFGSGFFGTVWFMVLLSSASFVAGCIFRNWFLKLITGGKWQG